MCLVAISWKSHPEYPLIISANRDEFFDRPTKALHQWDNQLIAGKDLLSGGTWMGFHPNGRWALVTNYRDFPQKRIPQISRGKLVTDFLESNVSPESFLDRIQETKEVYSGFNLVVSDGDRLFYFSNYGGEPMEVPPGIHGLSNGLLNDPWPKTKLATHQIKSLLTQELNQESLVQILKSADTYPLEFLPMTGVSPETEIQLSAQFIRMGPNYGTVSSSGVLRNAGGFTQILERNFDWDSRTYFDNSLSLQT